MRYILVFSAQALRRHQQHTLQSFKNTFSSRNLYQNMLRNTLFFEKLEKSPQRWGLCPQTPVGLRRLGSQTPELLFLSPVTLIFSKAFIALTSLLSKWNKIT